MLELTRLGGPAFALNPDLVERVEATPDTLVTLVGGNRYLVAESVDEVVDLVNLHRATVIAAAGALLDGRTPAFNRPGRGTLLALPTTEGA